MKKNSFKSDGQTVRGTLYFPQKLQRKNPAVMFIPGWTSDETGYKPRAEALTKLGFICLTISLRGHGASDGKMEEGSREDHLHDVLSAYDFLTSQKNVDKNQIAACGSSYGGYLGAILCAHRPIKWLILRAPALYLNKDFDMPTAKLVADREGTFFKNFKPEMGNFALVGIEGFTGDILIIESEFDQIIPHNIIKIYKQASRRKEHLKHKLIKNADHELSTKKYKQAFIGILVTWFKERLS